MGVQISSSSIGYAGVYSLLRQGGHGKRQTSLSYHSKASQLALVAVETNPVFRWKIVDHIHNFKLHANGHPRV